MTCPFRSYIPHAKATLEAVAILGETLTIQNVAAMMRHAGASATYKFALLKALVRVASRSEELCIPLTLLGEEFAKLYWNQTVIFHLRQAAVLSKEATAVRRIREIALAKNVHTLSQLAAPDYAKLIRQMAKLLTINVLRAFHASKPETMPNLYNWIESSDYITLSPESHAFLRANVLPLEVIANFHWADFLEGCNQLAPRIIQKVSRDAARRTSLARYMAILRADDDEVQCFYCSTRASQSTPMAIDHVIPWSFLLEDPLWDLVIACRHCNSQKSDWLPAPEFLERLKRRNHDRPLIAGQVSMLSLESDIDRYYNAAISVEWPKFWTPS